MIENHVTSIESSKRLEELGVKQESYFWWVNIYDKKNNKDAWFLLDDNDPYAPGAETYSAFLASELLELLPYNYNLTRFDGKDSYEKNDFYSCYDEDLGFGNETQFSEKSADACAKMLIHLIEQKIWVPK